MSYRWFAGTCFSLEKPMKFQHSLNVRNTQSSISTSILIPFERSWGHFGAILGPFAAISGPLGVMLWVLGAILGPLWAIFDTFWNVLEPILVPLEPSWSLLVHLDASGSALGDQLGAIWVPFDRHFAHS